MPGRVCDPMSLDEDDTPQPHELIALANDVAYAIPLTQVREVIRPAVITRVPGAPALVVGIVNVRGSVVTVLDLSVLLSGARAVAVGSIVLLEHGSRLVGLAVQSVRDVRAAHRTGDDATNGPADDEAVVPLDAAALCAWHLLSSEEMGP